MPANRNSYFKAYMRRYRAEILAEDEEHLAREKARKAAWYAANKEKKAAAQRKYRARKKAEQEENLKINKPS